MTGGARFVARNADGVAHANFLQILDIANHITDLARLQHLAFTRPRRELAHFDHVIICAGPQEANFLTLGQPSVQHAHVHNHAAITIKMTIEHHRAERALDITHRRRNSIHGGTEQVFAIQARLRADFDDPFPLDREGLLDFVTDLIHPSVLQIDFIDNRNDCQFLVHRREGVGDGLRLNTLVRIDE